MFWMVKFVPAELYIPSFKKTTSGVTQQQSRAMFYKYCIAVLNQSPSSSGWKRLPPEEEFFNGFKYTSREKAENMVRLCCDNLHIPISDRHKVCQVVEFETWPPEYVRFINRNARKTRQRSATFIPELKQAKKMFGTSLDYCYKCSAVIPPETFYMSMVNMRICGLCFMEMSASIADSLRKFELEEPEFYNRLLSARIVHHL